MKNSWCRPIRLVVSALFVSSAAVAAEAAEAGTALAPEAGTAAGIAAAAGPSSSLFVSPGRRSPMTQANYSWLHEMPREVKEIRKWDIITVTVSQQSTVISEGEMDRKKKAHADLILKDWILLKNIFHMVPDPQSAGDPHISGKLDNKMHSEATMETRDSIKFKIACHVVDIRPNGNLVIEGRHSIHNNREVWDCTDR